MRSVCRSICWFRRVRRPTHGYVSIYPGPGGFLISGRTGASGQSQTQIIDTWTWLHGRHEWQFGGEYRRVTGDTSATPDRYTYNFANLSAVLQGQLRFLTHDHL